jgi:antitoxin component of MazEF toxin-antitoxin module
MIGFRVQLNQNQALTVGLEGDHVVSVMITSTERDPERATSVPPATQRLAVGGLQTTADGSRSYLAWFDGALKIGDRVTVEVVDTSEVDVPRPRETKATELMEKFERQQLRHLLEKYGTP